MPGNNERAAGAGARSGCPVPPAARSDGERVPRRRLSAGRPAWQSRCLTYRDPIALTAVPFFDRRRPRIYAHRGGCALGPENTIAAFDLGLAAGADGLELDVRLSADGIPVVVHDATLDRTTDASGPVSARTAEELARVDAGCRFTDDAGGFPFRGRGIGVPALVDVLRRYPRCAHDHRAEGGHRGLRDPRGPGRPRGRRRRARVPGRLRVSQRQGRPARRCRNRGPAPAMPRCAGRCTAPGWAGRCARRAVPRLSGARTVRAGCASCRRASSGMPIGRGWRWRCGRWTRSPTWNGCCPGVSTG